MVPGVYHGSNCFLLPFPENLLIIWLPSFLAEEFPSAAPGHSVGKDTYL